MKTLKESIQESILADLENNLNGGDTAIKDMIKTFLKKNYNGTFKISKKPNADGKFEVSSSHDVYVRNNSITSFTNDLFVLTTIGGDFNCSHCSNLTSLKGAPEKVNNMFNCAFCDGLTSLEGAPTNTMHSFSCRACTGLTSLEGCPKEVDEFDCAKCSNLTSLKGAPEKVNNIFDCSHCPSLTSLKGAPKKIIGKNSGSSPYCIFNCSNTNITSLEGGPEEIGYNTPGNRATYSCKQCKKLVNFIGAPKTLYEFNCEFCDGIKSLDGFPKEVETIFATNLSNKFTKDDIDKICNVKNNIYM